MAGPNAISTKRYYLPTAELYETSTKFGNLTPAFNNNYDVWMNFSTGSGGKLRNYINQGGFYNKKGTSTNAGDYLALFCSEAVLPGSTLQTSRIKGLRQGVEQTYATYRTYPEVVLTWYSQTDYYTNEVFNNWMEFISPTGIQGGSHGNSSNDRRDVRSFRKLRYPEEYKIDMEITAFSKATTSPLDVLGNPNPYQVRDPSSITYYLQQAFPINIVAAPLAFGQAELIKTSVTFKYDYYYIDRTSRVGPILKSSDRTKDNIRDATA